MVQRLKIKQFYTAPTAIRLLLKCRDHYVHQYDRDTLRVLGCGMLLYVTMYNCSGVIQLHNYN